MDIQVVWRFADWTMYACKHIMMPMRRVSHFIPDDLLAAMKRLKAEHGTPEAETIRRALSAYLAGKGALRPTKAGGQSRRRKKRS
jgi:hypothetical protein